MVRPLIFSMDRFDFHATGFKASGTKLVEDKEIEILGRVDDALLCDCILSSCEACHPRALQTDGSDSGYGRSDSVVEGKFHQRASSPESSLFDLEITDDEVDLGKKNVLSSDEDLSQPVRPFKIKPLNKPIIPRQKWNDRIPKQKKRDETADIKDLIKGIEDIDVAAHKLQRLVEKKRDQKRQDEIDKRSLKRDRLGAGIVHAGKATILRAPKPKPPKKKTSRRSKSFIDSYEPQMLKSLRDVVTNPGSIFGLNHSISLETQEFFEDLASSSVKVDHTLQMDEVTQTNLKDFSDSVKVVAETLKSSEHKVTVDMGPNATQTLGGLGDFAIIALVAVVILILKPNTRKEKMYALSLVMCVLASRVDLIALLKKGGILDFFTRKTEETSPQGFGFDIGSSEEITSVVSALLNLYLFKSIGSDLLQPKEFLKVTTQISRCTPTVVGTMKGIGLLIAFLTTSLNKYFWKTDTFVKTGYPFIDAFWKDYKGIVDDWEARILHNREESVERVKAQISVGENIGMKLTGYGNQGSMRMAIFNAVAELTKIRKELMSSNFKYAGNRQEPLALLMIGRPGVFKSQAMQHVANAVHALQLSDEEFERYKSDPNQFIYNRQHEGVFWDGYTMDKTTVFFDDICQARDVMGTPDAEPMNIIRSINVFESNLHMAKLEDKGNTRFRAKLVIANTNMENFNLQSINEIGAFMRRWSVVVRVVPKAEFCIDPKSPLRDRVFDPEKFPVYTQFDCGDKPELIGTTKTTPDMCEFHLMTYGGNGSTSFTDLNDCLNFEELIKRVVSYYRMKEEHHLGNNVNLNETLKRFRKMREEDLASKKLEEDDTDRSDSAPLSDFSPEMHISESERNPFDAPFVLPDVWLIDYYTQTQRSAAIERFSRRNMQFVLFLLRQVEFVDGYVAENDLDRFIAAIELALEEIIEDEFDMTDTELPDLKIQDVIEILTGILCYVQVRIRAGVTSDEDICNHVPRNCGCRACVAGVSDRLDVEMTPQVGLEELEVLSVKEAQDHIKCGEFEDDFVLPESCMNYLRLNKVANYSKYLLAYFGFVVSMKKYFIQYGTEMEPHECFNLIVTCLSLETWKDYVTPDGKLLVDDLVTKVIGMYIHLEKRKAFRPPEEAMSYLDEMKSMMSEYRPSGIVGRLWDLYMNLILYLSATGVVVADELLSGVIKSEALRHMFGSVVMTYVGFIAGFTMIRMLVKFLWSSADTAPESNVRHEKIRREKKIARRPKTPYKPESAFRYNRGLESSQQMLIKNSVYDIWFPKDDDPETLYQGGWCLALQGHSVLMPWHFFSTISSHYEDGAIKGDDPIELHRPGRKVSHYTITVKQFLEGACMWDEGEKHDLIIIKMPKDFPLARNILGQIGTEAQQQHYSSVPAFLFTPGTVESSDGEITRWMYHVTARAGKSVLIGGSLFEPFEVERVYQYDARTTFGDCGGLLFINDKLNTGLVIGMHIAGSASRGSGMSAKLTREFLERYLNFVGEKYIEEDQIGIKLEPTEEVISDMTTLGDHSPEMKTPGAQQKSSYMKSLMFEKVKESPNGLAQLKPFELDGVRIDPMDIAREGYSGEHTFIEPEIVEDAAVAYFDHIEHVSHEVVDRRVYSFEEAVLGDGPGSEFGPIPRVTSAGFPYNTMGPPTSKKRFFGDGDVYDLGNDE